MSMESIVIGISEVKVLQRPSIPAINTQEPPAEKKKRVIHDLADDQKELRGIRIRLGMTKQAFAGALGIKQCTLDSYEYGKTKGVPVSLIEAARALDAQKSDDISSSREMFESKPMSEILSEWADQLHIPVDNAAALGRLLNTTPTTIRRWREDKVRPDLGKLSKLAARVARGPAGASVVAAKYAVKKLRSDSAESKGSAFIPESAIKMTVERLREVMNPSEMLLHLITDFESAVGICKRIPGDPTFVLMNSLTLNGFIRRFMAELEADELGNEDTKDK